MAVVLPKQVRAAATFLEKMGVGNVPPQHFAGAAAELGVSFRQLLGLIGTMFGQGQNEQAGRQNLISAETLKQNLESSGAPTGG